MKNVGAAQEDFIGRVSATVQPVVDLGDVDAEICGEVMFAAEQLAGVMQDAHIDVRIAMRRRACVLHAAIMPAKRVLRL